MSDVDAAHITNGWTAAWVVALPLAGFVGRNIFDAFMRRRQKRRLARTIAAELQGISDHHIANYSALARVAEPKADTPRKLAFEKMIYCEDEFYAISIPDIGQISPDIARRLLKFRMMLRNNALELRNAVDTWPSVDQKSRKADLEALKSRMQATALRAEDILREVKAYIKTPADEDGDPIDRMWPDWKSFESAREAVLDGAPQLRPTPRGLLAHMRNAIAKGWRGRKIYGDADDGD